MNKNPFEDTPIPGISQIKEEPLSPFMSGITSFSDNLMAGLTMNLYKPEDTLDVDREAHPIATTIGSVAGETVGTLGALFITSKALALFPFVNGAMKLASKGATVAEVVKGRVISDALTFGTYELTKEVGRQVKEKDPSIWDAVEKTSMGMFTGGLTGIASGMGSTKGRLFDAFAGGAALATAGLATKLIENDTVDGNEVAVDALTGFVFNAVLHRTINVEQNKIIAEKEAEKFNRILSNVLFSKENLSEDQIIDLTMKASGVRYRDPIRDIVRSAMSEGKFEYKKHFIEPDAVYIQDPIVMGMGDLQTGKRSTVRITREEKLTGKKGQSKEKLGKKVQESFDELGIPREEKRVENGKIISSEELNPPVMKKMDFKEISSKRREVLGQEIGLGIEGSEKPTVDKLYDESGKIIKGASITFPGSEKIQFIKDIFHGYKVNVGEEEIVYKGLGVTVKERKEIVRKIFGEFYPEEELKTLDLENLSENEADFLLKGIGKYLENYNGVSRGYEGIDAPSSRVKVPTIMKWLTSPAIYAERIGLADTVGPALKARDYVNSTMRDITEYLHSLEGQWIKLRGGISFGEKISTAFANEPAKAYRELFDVLTGVPWKGITGKQREALFEEALLKYKPEEQKIIKDLRFMTETALKRTNEALRYFNQEEIRSVEDYLTRVYQGAKYSGKGAFEPAGKFYEIPKEELFNPTAKRRTIEDPDINSLMRNPFELIATMWRHDLKTMFLTAPVNALHNQISALNKMGDPVHGGDGIPASVRNWMVDVVEHVVLRWPREIDNTVNASLERMKILDALNLGLQHFNRSMGTSPIKTISSWYGRNWDRAFIAGRPRQPIRNLLQSFTNLAFTDEKNLALAMLPESSHPRWMEEVMREVPMYKKTFGFMPVEDRGGFASPQILDKITFNLFQKSQEFNVVKSIRARIYQVEEYIKNPKYKNVGFRSPNRKGNEAPDFFYPEEREMMIKEADRISQASQFDYSFEGLPPFLQASTNKFLFKYLSYPANMIGNFGREVATRAFTGHPTWDLEGKINIPMKERTAMLRYLVYGTAAVMAASKAGIDIMSSMPWGSMPQGMQGVGLKGMMALGTGMAAVGTGDFKKAEANFRLFAEVAIPIPYQGMVRDALKVSTGEKTLKGYLLYEKRKTKEEIEEDKLEELKRTNPFAYYTKMENSVSPFSSRRRKKSKYIFKP